MNDFPGDDGPGKQGEELGYDILDYEDLEALLAELEALNSAAECHGMLVGQLCGGVRFDPAGLVETVCAYMDISRDLDKAQIAELLAVYHMTLAQLEDPEQFFYPLLPDDNTALNRRITCLKQWCEGFLAGFALIERNLERQGFTDELNEMLRDFVAISQLDADFIEDADEDDEKDFFEILEYVRLLTMNIFLHSVAPDSDGDKSRGHDRVAKSKSGGEVNERKLISPAHLFSKKLH